MTVESKSCNLERFADALCATLERERGERGIGTLGEKTLHSVLKNYFEPNPANHEIKVSGFVADIVNDTGIIEIQTRSFDRLRRKLSAFLEVTNVTVVCPVIREKQLVWIDIKTGEMTKKRKSPKAGKPSDAMRELCRIREFLGHERLNVCILVFDAEEYRMLDGWDTSKKRGSTRYERIPTSLCEEIYLKEKSDYAFLLPDTLPACFTAAEFRRAVGFGGMSASFVLKAFVELGACEMIGKRGRAFLYTKKESDHAN